MTTTERNELKKKHDEDLKYLKVLQDFEDEYPLPFGSIIETVREEIVKVKAELYDIEWKLRRR